MQAVARKNPGGRPPRQHFYDVQPNGCWNWAGANGDYGLKYANGRKYKAHRWMYEQHVGPIPAGHGVLHKCDNPSCVNQDHLFTGTQADNMQDCISKGRLNVAGNAKHLHARATCATCGMESNVQGVRLHHCKVGL